MRLVYRSCETGLYGCMVRRSPDSSELLWQVLLRTQTTPLHAVYHGREAATLSS